jgi:integrase
MHVKAITKESVKKEVVKPILLIDCLLWFLDFKRNVGVKEHLIKPMQRNSFNAFENHIAKWKDATEIAGEDFFSLRVDNISDKNVSKTINHLKGWSTSVQRKAFGFYNQFYSFLIENGYSITSPFKGIEVAEGTDSDARALAQNEFNIIKKAMSQGTPFDKEIGKIRYFNWLTDALTFNALTGRRREEFMNAKFSDIVLINGQLLGGYIKMTDYKFSRQTSHKIAFKNRITKAPIYPELCAFLMEMGYEKYKNSDRYIIGGDETKQRNTMANNLTNGFAFYRKKAGLSNEVELNGLRKKYITRMRNEFGDNSNFFTGHKSSRTDKKHYYDDSEIFEKVKNFILWK